MLSNFVDGGSYALLVWNHVSERRTQTCSMESRDGRQVSEEKTKIHLKLHLLEHLQGIETFLSMSTK